MTAENYRKYLEHEKAQGREVVQPSKDTERRAIWQEVFGEDKPKKGKSKNE